MGFTYILASKKNGTLYVGVTSDLERRVLQHRSGKFESFSKKYGCYKLVWFQEFETIREAIENEKKIKGWKRYRKLRLIEEENSDREELLK